MAANSTSPDCLSPDAVARLVKGGVPAAESERVHAHLEVCADCQRKVAEAVGADPEATWPLRTLAPGTQVSRFVIREFLGEGPGGTLFEADDPRHGRRVVVKFLRPDRHPDLVREEQALTKLSHPNVVNVQDAGLFQNEAFVVMELCEGQRLDEWLGERARTWREILDLFVDAARGLAAAHAQGLVHRDFKPENVLVGRDGRARVTNFGLAQAKPRPSVVAAANAAAAAKGELASSTPSGTPAYMAPEQFRGRPADARSDQFSFCVALYRALYGQQPFDPQWAAEQAQASGRRTPLGSVHFSLLVKALDRTTMINFAKEVIGGNIRPAPADTEVPGWLEGVVWRGLRTDPDDRYASMEVLLGDVEQGLEGSLVTRAPGLSRRSSLKKVAAIAGGAGVLVLLGALLWSRSKK